MNVNSQQKIGQMREPHISFEIENIHQLYFSRYIHCIEMHMNVKINVNGSTYVCTLTSSALDSIVMSSFFFDVLPEEHFKEFEKYETRKKQVYVCRHGQNRQIWTSLTLHGELVL